MSIVQERVAPILREAFPGRSIRLLAGEPITTSVQRVRVVLDDAERSLVVKRSDAISARYRSATGEGCTNRGFVPGPNAPAGTLSEGRCVE